MIEMYLMLVFIIIAAVVAVRRHSLVSSVIAVGAVGLGLSIIFLMLGAPELAITQLVVEILVLIVLIRATISISIPETYRGREILSYLMAAGFIAVFFISALLAFYRLPDFGKPLSGLSGFRIEQDFMAAGVKNAVSAVLIFSWRLDTLAILALIFTAVTGTLTILRVKGRKKVNERDEPNS